MSLDMLFNMFHKLKLMTAHGKITKNKTEIVNYLSVAQCTYNKDNINKTKTADDDWDGLGVHKCSCQ